MQEDGIGMTGTLAPNDEGFNIFTPNPNSSLNKQIGVLADGQDFHGSPRQTAAGWDGAADPDLNLTGHAKPRPWRTIWRHVWQTGYGLHQPA